ncbi:MAG: hypothetical protein HWQ35_01930 [Nostoc sp. NMS1]|uniref:hypothetical protein n=1 Tax=unclassified Nostoc TaxID=2593658 RepID=UPI0025D52A3E|nr:MULTISPECIES: hypothetical protein [unclassified Nostoc]MBN3905377.1 hypothetical protein [Nostoc sp. NMS1]MBN3992273.1 hypothetical protein [Nostoc sp. NMS2]
MLSNLDLVREFVDNSIQKKDILLANRSLTAQTVYNTNHLSTKAEGVIAIAQLNTTPTEFLILSNSSHWELLNQALPECNYLLKGNMDSRGFYHYQYCQIPKDYRLQCTKSVLLWRAWWKYRKNTLQLGIPSDLLIQTRDSWYPIIDLTISKGLLYVKTLGSEIEIHADDLVIWLSKTEVNAQN